MINVNDRTSTTLTNTGSLFLGSPLPVSLFTGMSLGLAYAEANDTFASLERSIADNDLDAWLVRTNGRKVAYEWFKRPSL